jgi:hypothetical protein
LQRDDAEPSYEAIRLMKGISVEIKERTIRLEPLMLMNALSKTPTLSSS